MAELAGDSDRAAVRFHDGFRDRQAHARALHQKALVLAAIEFVENQSHLHIFNARPVIGDAR